MLADRWLEDQGLGDDLEDTDEDDDGFAAAAPGADAWALLAASGFLQRQGVVLDQLTAALRQVWLEGWAIGHRASTALLTDTDAVWDWPAGDADAAGRSLPADQLAAAEEWIHRHGAAAQAITTGRLRALARLLAEAVTGRLANAQLADRIRQLLGDQAWAAMTALTEVVRAASAGTTWTYRHSGIVAVRWETEPNNQTCPRCLDLESEGAIPIGSAWADGTTAPPAHPRCRCYLSPA